MPNASNGAGCEWDARETGVTWPAPPAPAKRCPWLSSFCIGCIVLEEFSGMNADRTLLRDDQWERVAPLLPGKASDPGRTAANNRVFLEAVLWILRTGSPWRDLPTERFGRWNTAYQRFKRWSVRGVWHRVFSELAKDADFEELYLDGTIVRAHQHASGAAKKTVRKHWGALEVDSPPRSTPRSKDWVTLPRSH